MSVNNKHLAPFIRVAMYDTQFSNFRFDRVLWDYEIIYIAEGRMKLTIDKKVYDCIEGDILFLRPHVPHILESVGNEKVVQPHIHFDFFEDDYSNNIFVSFVKENKMSKEQRKWFRNDYLSEIELDLPPVIRLNNSYAIKDILYRLIDEFTYKYPYYEYFQQAYLIQLFAEIARNYKNNQDLTSNRHTKELNDLVNYIYKNADKNLSLDDLAKEVNISKFYLARLFKSTFNMSPHKYMSTIRLKRAKELIQFSNLQIQNIAFKMGFESPQSFTRWFKSLDGHSPVHYRSNKNVLKAVEFDENN